MRVFLALILTLMLFLSGCNEPMEVSFYALDTVISIKLIKGGNQQLLNRAVNMVSEFEAVFDRNDGELAKINASGGGKMSQELELAMTEALELCRQTEGAFDITVGALTTLWDFKKATLPSDADIDAALQKVGYEKITVNKGFIDTHGAQIDLGGFAKGYICDKVAQMLLDNGVTQAVLDLGGNIYCIGDKNGNGFNIGVADPNGGDPVCTVSISDCAAVTSGIYQRNFTKDGQLYHHIIDPKSGRPAQNALASATVICKSAARADVLSTAIMVQGENSEIIKNERVVLVYRDGTVREFNAQA